VRREQSDLLKIKPLKYDRKAERKMAANLKSFKKERDNSRIGKALEAVKRCAEKDENLVPPVFGAVEAYAKVGEISNVLSRISFQISFFRNGPSLLMTGI
jgi:methylmalonyl-CoA mutase N-terminal domain/subunit